MSSPQNRLKIKVTSAAQSAIKAGHPWVYGEAILDQNRPGTLGELAVLYDKHNRFLAVGFFDPAAPIRWRVIHTGKPVSIDAAFWHQKLETALERRRGLLTPHNNGFRLLYGESDGWPGLVMDKYAQTIVVKLYTLAWAPRLPEVIPLFATRLNPERIILRLSRNIQDAARGNFHLIDGQVLIGVPPNGPVLFRENGLTFEAEVLRGQKTGFFLDQRDNRSFLGELSAGRRVLNTFSFSGGFSLYAARGGAREVIDVDISQHALESGTRNFRLNRDIPAVRNCPRETVKADVFDWLRQSRTSRYDAVVIDPPSLARREAERQGALESYRRLVRSGIEQLAPGGLLLASSCSAHVSPAEFYEAVRGVLRQSRRPYRELRTCGHPADHAATFKEAEYLKAIWVELRKGC